ncbi:MAG: hypothetical protein V7603_2053 [Micromonosporaceae bacterium]
MMGFKWAGIISGTLAVGLVAMANVLLAALTRYTVPNVVNDFGIGLAAAGGAIAVSAHLFEQVNRKLDLMVDLFVARLEDLENRVGDRNTGFVEGYLLNQSREASVVPFTQHHLTRRGNGGG